MISSKKGSFLITLAKYKFITRKQFARLGVEKHNSAITKHCQPLLEADWIGVMDATNYGIGHVYYLKRKGALILSKELKTDIDRINFCINKPRLSSQTLFHRTAAIDCQIELFTSCAENDTQVIFYDRDIEVIGSLKGDQNLIRKTRIELPNGRYLEPDAIFMLDTSKGKKLFCLEFENEDYTKKSYQKIEKHVHALNIKSPSKKYKHNKAHKTLFVYKNPSTMESIMVKVKENISGIGNWFLFKTYDEVYTPVAFKTPTSKTQKPRNFLTGWRTVIGEVEPLY
ncbi:MAG TPA: hypothetical protein VFF29_06110 [Bacteroidota bacterium]|nr:hypothetical protein [Bacteroidota bacterium]